MDPSQANYYQPSPQQAPGAGYYQPQPPQTQQTTVVIQQQPQSSGAAIQNTREWSQGICACCDDLGECTYVWGCLRLARVWAIHLRSLGGLRRSSLGSGVDSQKSLSVCFQR